MTEQLSIVDENQTKVVSTAAELAALRESKGLSVAGTAAQLRLAPRQVEALEQGAWDKLPGLAFVKGALRSYGKFLRADLGPLIASLDQQMEKTEVKADRSLEGKLPERSALGFGEGGTGSKWVWGVLAAMGIAVAALYYGQGVDGFMPKKPAVALPAASGSRTETVSPMAGPSSATPAPGTQPPPGSESSAAAPGASPANPSEATAAQAPADGGASGKPAETSVPPAGVTAAPGSSPDKGAEVKTTDRPAEVQSASVDAAANEYHLSFAKDSWVEIKDSAGTRVLYGIQPGGSARTIKGTGPFQAVIGNSAHVRIVRRSKDGEVPVAMPKEAAQGTARMALN